MKSYRLIKPYFLEKRAVIFLGLFSLFVVDILQLFIPRIIKWAVDDLATCCTSATRLFHYALYIMGVAVLIGAFRFVWRRCLIGTSRRVEEGIRNQLFSHIQTLSAAYFDKTKTGDLMAHATNDVQHVRMAVGMGMVALTDAVVLGLAAIGFMLDMVQSADPVSVGEEIKVGDLLDRYSEKVDEAFAGQPEIESAVRATIGMTYQYLDYFEARGEAERYQTAARSHMETALDLRREALGDEHPKTLELMDQFAVLLKYQG